MKKTNKLILVAFAVTALLGLNSCATSKKEKAPAVDPNVFVKEMTLAEAAAPYGFKVGGAIGASEIGNQKYKNMISSDFNSVTATNELKAYSLLDPSRSFGKDKAVLRWGNADYICEWAQECGIGVRGHVLVWDAYMPDWYFREKFDRNNDFVDSDTMKERLRDYIFEVVTHFETKFPGVVYCWDVVNEAVGDGPADYQAGDARHVRSSRNGGANLFYQVIGPDYVEFAFKCAREAVNSVNPDIKLFYNDYNTFMPYKRSAICELVKSINKDEKLCDGVGMQGYIGGYGSQNGCMNPGDIYSVKDAILTYAKLGVEVQLTEVALRNYENDEVTAKRHCDFYASFFKMLKSINTPESSPLTCVAIWGLVDNPSLDKNNYSYKMNGPYCGLYDWRMNYKEDFKAVYKILTASDSE